MNIFNFEKLSAIEKKHSGFINLILKPLITTIFALCIAWFSMWLSVNYVKQDKFLEYTEKQNVFLTSNFKETQLKLDDIVEEQRKISKDILSNDIQISVVQKSVENANERLTYLERKNSFNNQN